MPSVNPELLIWARRAAGLDESQAAKKLKIALGRLADLEGGETDPTPSMLERMSRGYRQPLIAFYLLKPPIECDYGVDFRTHHDSMHNAESIDADLKALIRNVLVRQGMLKAELEDEEETEALSFVASQRTADGVANVVVKLHQVLGVSSQEYYAMSKPEFAFDLLRDRTHRAGVFVLLKSDLGSHHSAIEVEKFRGFVIADSVAPFVVINGRDAKSALSFTLLHELAHLILGNTGISGIDSENDVERFCNDVASDFLLPTNELEKLSLRRSSDPELLATQILEFSAPRNLSRSMVAYRAWRLGMIASELYRRLDRQFRVEWNRFTMDRRHASGGQRGGPGYYVTHKYRVGRKLIKATEELFLSGALTTFKAAKILNVKAGNVQKMFDST